MSISRSILVALFGVLVIAPVGRGQDRFAPDPVALGSMPARPYGPTFHPGDPINVSPSTLTLVEMQQPVPPQSPLPGPAMGPGGPMPQGPMPGGYNPEQPDGSSPDVRRQPIFEFGADYLAVWYSKMNFRFPTLTTGSATDPIPGALDSPGTIGVFPGYREINPSATGVRLRMVVWSPHVDGLSLEGNWLAVEQRSVVSSVSSADVGNAPLGRPFFNTAARINDALPVNVANVFDGKATDAIQTRLMGGEGNIRYAHGGRCSNWTTLLGVRWLKLDERYYNADQIDSLIDGSRAVFQDNFTTYNNFIGGQFGLQYNWQGELLRVELGSKLALGSNRQTLQVAGSSRFTDPVTGVPFVDPNVGNYANPTNIGEFRHSQFTVVPELNVNVHYCLSQHCKVSVGYTAFCLCDALRPGRQIGYAFEPQALGQPVPANSVTPKFFSENFWVQTLNLGLEFAY